MIVTNPHHILHTILTDDQCHYWRFPPPTNLSSLLQGLEPSTYSHIPFLPWKPVNVSFSSLTPPPQTTVLYYIPSSTDDHIAIHVASRTHTVYTLLRSFTGTDHTQALGLAILSSLREFPDIPYHFIHLPSFEQKLMSSKKHRDSNTYLRIQNTIDSSPLTHFSFHLYYTRAKDSPNHTQRLQWNHRFSTSLTQLNTSPSLSPRKSMWKKIKEEYTPIDHPSALACQTPDNGKPVAAVRGALRTHSRIVTSTIFHIATGHCFDANYSQRFRPRSEDTLTCPHTHTRPHLHTRHHVIFQCSQYANERRRLLPRPWRLPVILQSEDASEKLGLFLKESNCSLLRPIPTPNLLTNRQSPTPPLNPEPP